jgi:TRAP transporter TAXI family solute receptor
MCGLGSKMNDAPSPGWPNLVSLDFFILVSESVANLEEESMIANKCKNYICFKPIFRRVSIIVTILLVTTFPFSANAFDILLGTGETETFSHFAGRMLCRVINRHSDDLNCTTVPGPGDVHNLTNLQGGSLDIGLIDSRMLHDAMNKSGTFEFFDISYDNLPTLVPLYDDPITLVVRKDANIASLAALKGKRINAGAPLSLQRLAVNTIMRTKNWTKADFSLVGEISASLSQDTIAFCHGEIQAMVHIGVHPDSSLQQLLRLCKADLVSMYDKDIEKLVNDHPAFFKTDIAAGTYPSHPSGVTTFGTRAVLVVSQDLDEQTVYTIMDAIYSNRKRLQSAHKALSLFTADATRQSEIGIQLHPGAVKYFSEQGQ